MSILTSYLKAHDIIGFDKHVTSKQNNASEKEESIIS